MITIKDLLYSASIQSDQLVSPHSFRFDAVNQSLQNELGAGLREELKEQFRLDTLSWRLIFNPQNYSAFVFAGFEGSPNFFNLNDAYALVTVARQAPKNKIEDLDLHVIGVCEDSNRARRAVQVVYNTHPKRKPEAYTVYISMKDDEIPVDYHFQTKIADIMLNDTRRDQYYALVTDRMIESTKPIFDSPAHQHYVEFRNTSGLGYPLPIRNVLSGEGVLEIRMITSKEYDTIVYKPPINVGKNVKSFQLDIPRNFK